MKKSSPFIFCLALFTANLSAQNYQYEVSAGTSATDLTFLGIETELDSRFAGIRYYFQPVKNRKAPLNELAFVNRSSSIGGTYLQYKTGQQKESLYEVDGRFVFSKVYIFEAAYSESDFSEMLSVAGGMYLGSGTEFIVRYSETEESESEPTAKEDEITFSLHTISPLYRLQFISTEFTVGKYDSDDSNGYLFDSTVIYYPLKSFGLGVTYNTIATDGFSSSVYGVLGHYFVVGNIVIEVEYLKSEDLFLETESLSAGITYRF